MQQQQLSELSRNPKVTADNLRFVKEVVELTLRGDGIGWLKHGRLKKLMEEETYRGLAIGRLNKDLTRRIERSGGGERDEHLQDVVRSVTQYSLLH